MASSAEFVRLVDLAETVGARREPTKAIAFSPQAPNFFNIIGFLVIFRSLYGIFRVKREIFRASLEKFRKDL